MNVHECSWILCKSSMNEPCSARARHGPLRSSRRWEVMPDARGLWDVQAGARLPQSRINETGEFTCFLCFKNFKRSKMFEHHTFCGLDLLIS